MKKTLTILVLLLICSCNSGGTIEQLRINIQKSIAEKIVSEGGGVEIVSFTLSHVNGNDYLGVLETMENGTAYSYLVNVIYDGNSFVWEIPPSEMSLEETDAQRNSEDTYSDNAYEETDSDEEEDHKNMTEAMENISDPTYCSLCKGTGIEENRARGTGFGDNEYGRICPMCNGSGKRSY